MVTAKKTAAKKMTVPKASEGEASPAKAVKKSPAPVKKAGPAKPEVDHGSGRKILYVEVGVILYKINGAMGLMTAAVAKKMLGWTEEGDDKFEMDYDLKDRHGKKIRLLNNLNNRPLRPSLVKTWESEVLNDRWNGGLGNGPNGETMIIGKTGLCLDCQHRLVGLVLADQEYAEGPENWPALKGPPGIECLVVTGISESSKVVDTINTGEPRSLADVIFRDSQYFDGLHSGERAKVAKIAEHAIRMLGHRTAAFADAFAPNRTHSEQIEFLHRHATLLECVSFVYDVESEGSVSSVVSLGTAAALMFLMASSGDPGDKYAKSDRPNDQMLKWGHKDLAKKFWKQIGDSEDWMFPIKEAIAAAAQDADSVSKLERIGIVVKAWLLFAKGTKLTPEALTLEYTTDGEGTRHLNETPLVSVIDVGSPKKVEEDEEEDEVIVEDTPEQKKLQKEIRSQKLHRPIKIGDRVWVKENPVEASWSGELVELVGKNARIIVGKGFAGAGKRQACLVAQLCLIQPT